MSEVSSVACLHTRSSSRSKISRLLCGRLGRKHNEELDARTSHEYRLKHFIACGHTLFIRLLYFDLFSRGSVRFIQHERAITQCPQRASCGCDLRPSSNYFTLMGWNLRPDKIRLVNMS